MEKLERDGKIAVIYSPGYGAGWSTWNQKKEELCMDARLAELLEAGNMKKFIARAKEIDPDVYVSESERYEIEWIQKGDRFEIQQYDGDESVRVLGPAEGFLA